MFTGIIREKGVISSLKPLKDGKELTVLAPAARPGLSPGDSVAVDGVCLTADALVEGGFSAYASGETLRRTTLSLLKKGAEVNIEPALKPTDPMGGHFIQGHVEGVGRVASLSKKSEEWVLRVEVPRELMKAVVVKGSIALSGVSLTVSAVAGDTVEIVLIPFTLKATTFPGLRKGSPLNVETDIIARTVVGYLEKRNGLSVGRLMDEGF